MFRSRRNLILGGVLAMGAAGGGLSQLLRYSRRQQRELVTEFEPGSMYDVLQDTFQTGDVILFDAPVLTPSPINSVYRFLARYCNAHADCSHVGVIIKNEEEDGFPFVLEQQANRLSFLPFDTRILHSHASMIIIRRLDCKRTPESIARVNEFVDKLVQRQAAADSGNTEQLELLKDDTLYDSSSRLERTQLFFNLLVSLFSSSMPMHHSRVHTAGLLVNLQEDMRVLREKTNQMRENGASKVELRKSVEKFLTKKTQVPPLVNTFRRKTRLMNDSFATVLGRHTFPDAELVAKVLQQMQVLPPTEDYFENKDLAPMGTLRRTEFSPTAFTENTSLPMINSSSLDSPLIFWTSKDRAALREQRGRKQNMD